MSEYCLNIGGIDCKELNEGSGQAHLDFTPGKNSFDARRVFICDWSDRLNLVANLKGTTHPNILFCPAYNFDVEPFGKPVGENTWERAKITANYRNVSYDVEGVELKTVRISTRSETISLQSDGVEFESGSEDEKRVDTNPQAFISFADISVTFYQNVDVDEPAWANLFNKVNSNNVKFGGSGFKTWTAGTLLYCGYDLEEIFATDGKHYTVVHKFLGSEIDHRKDFDPYTGTFTKIKLKGSGNYKYGEANFSGVF